MTKLTEKVYVRSHEPIFWGLFGAGGMLCAFLTPVMILITGLLIPMGYIDRSHFSYNNLHSFAGTWYGAIIILVLVALPLWHTLHRIFHGLHDLGVKRGRDLQQVLCYGFAFSVSVFVFALLIQMF
ncbi:fumarate reductase subunit D [Psychromonas sp. CNPT3]|uniref:fumarate reductase subunit FrdD n=1 Tax=Psychromonas sp. CNPT3 TaxID=314282 RepID=UPI00006E7655|nr:fumarate reductase subunit FrdD [Psychromonas sp. CNPT3]AGH80345.1 fumarate reductase subunit D [Psychromonas sp. CNPT3]